MRWGLSPLALAAAPVDAASTETMEADMKSSMHHSTAPKKSSAPSTPMTQAAASRIQSATAKASGGVPKGGFAARGQRAATKRGR